ncbi:MAG TPA: hypothetical protein VMG62_05390 [Solirubrobacteraceae bacterium]|nr:hypothetical protein [Solirubrobacteraceae bacterium]
MSIALGRLASEVGTGERTLRRAAGSGLIHRAAAGAAEIEVTEREMAWVRSHWALVDGTARGAEDRAQRGAGGPVRVRRTGG